MPPLPLLNTFIDYASPVPLDLALATRDASEDALQVVCAWPLSSQYGPGSRVLYYVLIAACVLAREAEWIRNACLAAALLLPTIAALHAIVLAAVHVDGEHATSPKAKRWRLTDQGAVDMDIYGAFQLCSIGILAAPVTVRLSNTYLYDPGRNTIFVWAGLILAGLVSLTVEFYRINTFDCTDDGYGHAVSPDSTKFPYDAYDYEPTCHLRCSVDEGPFSPMRGGSADNIYVIPAPEVLSLGTAMLLSAACGVHAIVWLLAMTEKILEINWKSQSGEKDDAHEPIAGTNGATKVSMKEVNNKVKVYLSMAIIPIFGGAGLALLIVGEINFFSQQLKYQNEPMEAIGQWGSIVGVALALLGSLYLVLADDMEAVRKKKIAVDPDFHCQCIHHSKRRSNSQIGEEPAAAPNTPRVEVEDAVSDQAVDNESASSDEDNDNNRRKLAKMLLQFGDSLGTIAHERFDDSGFKLGKSRDYPEIPGEKLRSPMLPKIQREYNPPRDSDGNATPVPRSRSRARSFIGAGGSGAMRRRISGEGPPCSPPPRRRSSTVPVRQASLDLLPIPTFTHTATHRDQSRGRPRLRRDMLEVPAWSSHDGLGISHARSEDVSPHAMSGGRGSDSQDASEDEEEVALPTGPPVIHVSAEPATREGSPATFTQTPASIH